MIPWTITLLARLFPWTVEPSPSLVEALAFIESDIDPVAVVRAGFGLGGLSTLFTAMMLTIVLPWWSALAGGLCVGLGATHGLHAAPSALATLRRTRAVGASPDLVASMVLRMHLEPTTESAAAFAAESGSGPLATSLASHVARSVGTPHSGLIAFAEEWAEWFPSLRRSAYLLVAAEEAPPGERVRTLDRALEATLVGTRDQMATFTTKIRGPATGLYAFGVMLPLALVALVPAAAVAGFTVSIWVFVVIYLGLLPAVLVLVGGWLLARRPVAFPPPRVRRRRSWLWPTGAAIGACLAVGASVAVVASGNLALLASVSTGLGVGLLVAYRPVAKVRRQIRAIEENLPDAIYLIGQHVGDGLAVEAAIELAGDRIAGETGTVFSDAARLQRRLPLDVERAFLGPAGVLMDIPSPRMRGMSILLATAASEGQPAGIALVRMADHLQDLQRLERETRRDLATVTGALDSTATVFAPLVAGSTIALGSTMADAGVAGTEAVAVGPLTLAVGGYVVLLAAILTTLSIGLRYGLDRPLVGYRVGRALAVSMPLYVASLVVVGTLL